ncbi:MAG: serine/threonine protein phosphatase [Planctomycetaceae bacterium]|nr:serine/threonine protein phosphatase [Planctomycetaceae bacterium]
MALAALIDAIQPGPEDVMITLGDYINRGPDSRGVLDLLIRLGRRCRLFPLLGNHDQVLLDIWAGRCRTSALIRMGGLATLDSYGPGRRLDNIPREHFAFLEGCRDYHETDTHIFVHANYFPNLPMDEQTTLILRWESLRDRIPDPHHSGKTVIAGHTSRKGGEVLDLGYLKCIDTWCVGGGWLTAMEVETGRTWQADRQGMLRCRA